MKISECKNIEASGSLDTMFGVIPLYKMTHDAAMESSKPKLHLQESRQKKKEFRACRYSDSCFACPKGDCVAKAREVAFVNILPDEHDLLLLGGR